MNIKVTEVNVRCVNTVMRTKAMASVVLNDAIRINNIKVFEGQKGLFIVMPSIKLPNGEFKDIVHPINSETREIIQEAILAKYEEITKESKKEE